MKTVDVGNGWVRVDGVTYYSPAILHRAAAQLGTAARGAKRTAPDEYEDALAAVVGRALILIHERPA